MLRGSRKIQGHKMYAKIQQNTEYNRTNRRYWVSSSGKTLACNQTAILSTRDQLKQQKTELHPW